VGRRGKRVLSYTLAAIVALTAAVVFANELPLAAETLSLGEPPVTYEQAFPDANFRAIVLGRYAGGKSGSSFITEDEMTQMAAETSLDLIYQQIADLTGIEYFTGLTVLYCYGNQLTALDVSRNIALKDLRCYGNQLTALDVSNNTALEDISCGSNQLTALDVSRNTALTELSCSSNLLTALDVSNNTALKTLYCNFNPLTALDVSNNTALTELRCTSNQLTALDVSCNTALTELWCSSNQLTALDVLCNTALKILYCSSNQLTALDVSRNTALTELWCYHNYIQSSESVIGYEHLGDPVTYPEPGGFVFYPQKNPQEIFLLSGKIKSYNPKTPATVQLLQNGLAVYTETIAATDESGPVEQSFQFPSVAPGTYILRITKPAHTSYTVNNITVTDHSIDLTQDNREPVKLITMLVGDLNGDGQINVSDLNTVWSRPNYNKSAASPDVNALCDLDGDGFINVTDLNILWSRANYNKSGVAVEYNH
jgi:Leucine-rich repeat (LRR) protein